MAAISISISQEKHHAICFIVTLKIYGCNISGEVPFLEIQLNLIIDFWNCWRCKSVLVGGGRWAEWSSVDVVYGGFTQRVRILCLLVTLCEY